VIDPADRHGNPADARQCGQSTASAPASAPSTGVGAVSVMIRAYPAVTVSVRRFRDVREREDGEAGSCRGPTQKPAGRSRCAGSTGAAIWTPPRAARAVRRRPGRRPSSVHRVGREAREATFALRLVDSVATHATTTAAVGVAVRAVLRRSWSRRFGHEPTVEQTQPLRFAPLAPRTGPLCSGGSHQRSSERSAATASIPTSTIRNHP